MALFDAYPKEYSTQFAEMRGKPVATQKVATQNSCCLGTLAVASGDG